MAACPPMVARSGDGFIRCSDGHVRWGIFGAAGVVFVHRVAPDAVPSVFLQLRSEMSHEGGTWSCPGGAVDLGETVFDAAMREAGEEIGLPPEGARLIGEYVFAPAVDWSYTTVVVEVPEPFGEPLNFETAAVEWVPAPDVDGRRLHPGFGAAWPHLRTIVMGDAG